MIKKLIIVIFISINLISKSNALIEVDITRGNLNPLPIAVSPLFSDNQTEDKLFKETDIKNIGIEIAKVVENNFIQQVR